MVCQRSVCRFFRHYDSAIFNYFDDRQGSHFRAAVDDPMHLRYGENPHQAAKFYGKFDNMFDQLHGKEISYNNLLDIDSAVNLIEIRRTDVRHPKT